jgi:hypothetical protein
MTPLRQRMIKAMQMRGFSPRTHDTYLGAVLGLAKFTRRSPDTLNRADLKRYCKQWDGRPHLETASMCQSGCVIDHSNRRGRPPCRLRQSVST